MTLFLTKRFWGLLIFTLFNLTFLSASNPPETGCGVPTNIRHFDPTATTLTMYWDYNPDAIAYQIQMRPVGTTTWTVDVRVPYNSATVRNLVDRTDYECRISTICAIGQSAFCTPFRFSTNVDCVPPINIVVSNITTNSAKLTWSPIVAAAKYEIEYKAASETTWRKVETTNTNITLTGLTTGTYYQYKICANCPACVAIECSPILSFTTTGTATCGVTSNLSATNITTNSATLSWAAVSGATSYQVRLRPEGTAGWAIIFNSNTTTANVTNLQSNTRYEWQVASFCGDAGGDFCLISTFTTLTPPPSPNCAVPTCIVTNCTASSFTISWNGVSGVVKFRVEYKPLNSGTWQYVDVVALYATLTNLLPNTTYQIRSCSYCVNSNTPSCTEYFYCTTLPNQSCGIATNLNETNITTSSAVLSWSSVNGATAYRVRYRIYGTNTWTTLSTTANSYLSVINLAANTTYEWQVQAICGNTEGVYCDASLFTTQPLPVCNAPTNLQVLALTTNSAQLSWNSVSNASKYIVEYKIAGAATSQTIETTNTSITLTGLNANTNYQFKICAFCPNCPSLGCSVWYPFTTQQNISCGTPTNLTQSNITTTSARVSWTAVSGASSYTVRVRILGTTTWLNSTVVYGTSPTISYLSPNTTYEWQVIANCGSVSGTGISSSFTTLGVCGTPVNLVATNITATNATLNWSSISTASKYIVEYKATSETTWRRVETTGTSLNINNLAANTQYEFRVCAVCPGCIDPFCSTICLFKTLTPPCTAPTNLNVINISTTGATFTWAAVSYATKYIVQYMPVGEVDWKTVETTATSLTVTDLSANTNYQFRVCTMCAGSTSTYCSSLISFKTLPLPCTAPTNLAATNITTTGATLTWAAVAGITSYTVEYMLPNEPAWRTVTCNTNSVTISGLSPNTQYIFRVCVMCAGYSQATCSANCYFQTLQVQCGIPTNLLAYNIAQTSANLSWSAISGATSYHVRVRSINSAVWEHQGTVYSNSAKVSGLIAGTTYVWQVSANCSYGQGSYCTLSQFQTPAAPIVCSNDEACSSIGLTANPTLMYTNGTNANSTLTTSPTLPTTCPCPTVAYDVWYKVDMPSTGKMTITVTGDGSFNPVMGVYYGYSCSSLYYLGCRFDISSYNAAPTMSLAGAAGVSIYIRVWGYNGQIGNFKIGVTNGASPIVVSGREVSNSNDIMAENVRSKEGGDNTNEIVKITTPSNTTPVSNKMVLNAYPNPVQDILNVEYQIDNDVSPVSISLSDISGKVIYQQNTEGVKGINYQSINTSDLTNGMYILKITHQQQQKVQKIQVSH